MRRIALLLLTLSTFAGAGEISLSSGAEMAMLPSFQELFSAVNSVWGDSLLARNPLAESEDLAGVLAAPLAGPHLLTRARSSKSGYLVFP